MCWPHPDSATQDSVNTTALHTRYIALCCCKWKATCDAICTHIGPECSAYLLFASFAGQPFLLELDWPLSVVQLCLLSMQASALTCSLYHLQRPYFCQFCTDWTDCSLCTPFTGSVPAAAFICSKWVQSSFIGSELAGLCCSSLVRDCLFVQGSGS